MLEANYKMFALKTKIEATEETTTQAIVEKRAPRFGLEEAQNKNQNQEGIRLERKPIGTEDGPHTWPSAHFILFASMVHHRPWTMCNPRDLHMVYGAKLLVIIMVYGTNAHDLHDKLALCTPRYNLMARGHLQL